MKYGFRTPSFKKSFSARTKGRMTRSLKRSVNPYYGKKGTGWVNNPKKAAYNSVYHRTTRSAFSGSSINGVEYAIILMIIAVVAIISFVVSHWLFVLLSLAFIGVFYWIIYKEKHSKWYQRYQARSEAYMKRHPLLQIMLFIVSVFIFILFKFILK